MISFRGLRISHEAAFHVPLTPSKHEKESLFQGMHKPFCSTVTELDIKDEITRLLNFPMLFSQAPVYVMAGNLQVLLAS